jgi:hypothetical protein
VWMQTAEDTGTHSRVRIATVEDLRRACETAGLTLATARHAEDLEKLGKEMAEVVSQRDAARDSSRRLGEEVKRYLDLARELLGADKDEPWSVAARRVVAERDIAIARAEKAEAEVEDFAGLVRELNPRVEKAESDSAALADLYNQSRDRADALAARVRAERPACLVARAVALECDVRLLRNTIDTSLWSLTVGGEAGTRHNITASEVPGAMGLALDYVERMAAARKGGAK